MPLGFYGRDVPEPVLRRLIASEDVGLRSSAIVGGTARRAQRGRALPGTVGRPCATSDVTRDGDRPPL
jgi:hypothetical protein